MNSRRIVSFPALRFDGRLRDRLLGAGGSTAWRWLGALALLATVGVLVHASVAAWRIQRELADARQGLAERDQTVAAPAPVRSAVTLPGAAERTRINQVVHRLNTPWPTILDALEREAAPGVAVLAVESDPERGSVRVITQGRSVEVLLEHAARLQQDPQFAQVNLLRLDSRDSAAPPRLAFDLVLVR